MNNEIIYTDTERKKLELDKKIKANALKKRKIILWILLSVIGVLIIAGAIGIAIYFTKTKTPKIDETIPKTDDISKSDEIQKDEETNKIIIPQEPIEIQYKKLDKEFEIVTNIGELKRISVVQRSLEETKLNDNMISTKVTRKTNYDIYIISEEDADEENKLFYSKMYTAAISIVSECISSDGDDCNPKRFVDLTSTKKSNSNNNRVLNSIEDFKDIPVALCLFNITDNNFITSMTCPESFSETKKNEIILDLYFFRPPAIQRADKDNDNITLTINEDKNNNKIYIRETNGGLCNIYDSFDSMCTTDMNTTTDLKGHLLSYDELAITNITTDDKNSFIKNKMTNLVDISEKIENLDPAKYKESLDKLLPMLNPYMKVDIHFTTDNFTDLYNLVQDKSKSSKKTYLKKKNKKTYRSLMEYAGSFTKEQQLFSYKDSGGIQINYNLKTDSGINTESMKSNADLDFDDEENHLSSLEEFTDLQLILDELIELSKAGNHLATDLYEKIKDKLEGITNEISERINSLINLLKYYDLSDVFDSTLLLDSISKLPISILEESNSLVNKLSQIYNGIKSGSMKNYVDNLSDRIYNYNKQLHKLIKNIFDNLKELGKTLSSKNNQITEITTYYLNHTSSSYVNTIQEAENLLNNYYKNEYDLIYPKVQSMLKEFQDIFIEDLEKERKIINNLYIKLNNKTFTIDFASDEDYKTIILNLYNADKYINDIIDKIKEYINEKIGIKDSGYFTSNYDINENNKTFSAVLNEAKEEALKLDKDEYIDKKFDEIMIKFRDVYTEIMKYMERVKSEQFPLNENTLETSLFKASDKNKIETDMTTFRVQISNKIKEENDYYIDEIKKFLSKFLTDNSNVLTSLISDLDIIFSEESLKKLANSFETAFNSCLKKITDDIKKNEATAKNYFDNLYNMVNNNNFLIEKLKTYKVNEIPSYRYVWWFRFARFIDYITSKEKTSGYISKYNAFIANFDYSKKYLANQLYLDIVNEYKKILTQIREILQSVKNNKITEKYPDFPELEFYNNHIRTIDKMYNRLNKYFSDDLFNNKFISPINNNKKVNSQYVDSIKTHINTKHQSINKLAKYNDNKNDFCITYKRKLCYGCTNCAWYTYVSDRFCLPLPTYSNNYNNLIKSAIQSDSNLIKFNNEFNEFFSKIKNKINDYNNRFKYMEGNFTRIKTESLNQNFTLNYLSSIKNSVKSILSEKYGDKIIRASYNYYQSLINERLQIILDNVTDKWDSAYNDLISDIDSNYDNFKNTLYEYGLMAKIYETTITKNITKNYFDSIVLFQKTEFNYTIAYYYNYYLKIVKEAYQYILSKIPKNENGFNDIIEKRRKEINDVFTSFINNITNSKNEALNIQKQKDILQVPETNFFNVNSILSNNIYTTSQSLKNKIKDLEYYEGEEEGNELSLISRFYLENKENGKQIEQFYDPVNHEIFFDLNLEQFKDIMIDNWIFDQDDFINRLNQTLYETTKEIRDEVSTKKENYSNIIENEIDKYFIDDSIENKISNLYLSQIKDLNPTQINNINTNINKIINKIKTIITQEATRIETTSTSYNSDYSTIKNTLNYYKTYIFNEINTTIFNVLEGFYKNIYKNVYTNCMESKLNEYEEEGKKSTSLYYDEKILYNSTYKIGEIIENIMGDILSNYKEITKKKIISKYNEYYEKIKSLVNINAIQNLIKNEIDNIYNSKLLPALQKFATYTPGDDQYSNYDLGDNYKNEINLTITQEKNNINNIIILTKGDNYDAKFNECIDIDFSSVSMDIIRPICEDFKKILSSEKEEQKNKINNLIQNIIKSNFDDLLNNIIPTFGNQFFERIIKYNENFKIISLYNNLKYTLSQTLLYYVSLNAYADVDEIPKDLKNRLYNLNNLDLTVEKKNKQILKHLNAKINEFIKESKINIMEKYMSYLQEDVSINNAFKKIILERIDDNLIQMQPEMEKNYQNMLDKYLRERLIDSYSKIMNDKTNEMIKLVNQQKEILKSKIDDLFSLDSDKVLSEVNEKINNTLDSINEYNNYFETFDISNDIINYLNKFGSSTVKPKFEDFKNELNKATKDKLIDNINRTSQQIENLSPDNFILQTNNSYKKFNETYIQNISLSIDLYGTDDYPKNLDIERNKKRARLRRRLNGEQTDEEIAEDSRERIEDGGIEDTFQKILSTSENTRNYFDSLKAFSDFDKKINNYKNNLNIAYKSSKEQIKNNEYEEEIDNYLNSKLNNLSNTLNNYYDKINESYYQLRDFLNKSLHDIDNTLNRCKDITYNTFNFEYEKISNKTQPVYTKYNTTDKNLNTLKYTKKTEHKVNKVLADLFDYKEYGEFKFDLIFEGTNFKKPKVVASIINKSKPKKAKLQVSSPFGTCGETINELEIEFNDANYTMYIESENNNINVTTLTNFDKYKYSTEVYQIGETNETIVVDMMDLEIEYQVKCKKLKDKVLTHKFETEVDIQNITETFIIQG